MFAINLNDIKVPKKYRQPRADALLPIETSYREVVGGYRGPGLRPFNDTERAMRRAHLVQRIDVLCKDEKRGLTFETQDEVPRDAESAAIAARLHVRPRFYVIRLNGVHVYGSRRWEEAFKRYEYFTS